MPESPLAGTACAHCDWPARGYRRSLSAQSLVVGNLPRWRVLAVAVEGPGKDGVAAVAFDERAAHDVAAGRAWPGEVAADQPVHHGLIGRGIIGLAPDGGVEEKPAELLRSVGVVDDVPAHHLADTFFGRVLGIALKGAGVEVGFAVHPGR